MAIKRVENTSTKVILLPDGTTFSNAIETFDVVPLLLRELTIIRNPSLKFSSEEKIAAAAETLKKRLRKKDIVYALYSWKNSAVRLLAEELFFEIKTNRNRNIITKSEQLLFRNANIALAGLSIGSHILFALALCGGPKKVKIADPDHIELSNLNRLDAALQSINTGKATHAARHILELDPYLKITTYSNGISVRNIEAFVLKPRIDVLVEETDDINLKIMARLFCKKARVPVVMVTNNADDVILDVERFDLEPHRPIFHGKLGSHTYDRPLKPGSTEWIEVARKILGDRVLKPRVIASLSKIGTELAGVPQLGSTAYSAGGLAASAIRKIIVDRKLSSGRYFFSMTKQAARREKNVR
jgi:molybdopterin/thiamine biosynthesis adenylyltransferase